MYLIVNWRENVIGTPETQESNLEAFKHVMLTNVIRKSRRADAYYHHPDEVGKL